MQRTITVRTERRRQLVDITRQIADAVAASKVSEGLCTVFTRHTTTGVVVNEVADAGFRADLVSLLERWIPDGAGWEHDKVDDNGASHLQAALLGPSRTVPVQGGKLLLGTWQGIALVECDGPRERKVVIDVRG